MFVSASDCYLEAAFQCVYDLQNYVLASALAGAGSSGSDFAYFIFCRYVTNLMLYISVLQDVSI